MAGLEKWWAINCTVPVLVLYVQYIPVVYLYGAEHDRPKWGIFINILYAYDGNNRS